MGSAPNPLISTHASATVTNPSRAKIALLAGRRSDSGTPSSTSSAIVTRKARRSPSP